MACRNQESIHHLDRRVTPTTIMLEKLVIALLATIRTPKLTRIESIITNNFSSFSGQSLFAFPAGIEIWVLMKAPDAVFGTSFSPPPPYQYYNQLIDSSARIHRQLRICLDPLVSDADVVHSNSAQETAGYLLQKAFTGPNHPIPISFCNSTCIQ
jgi:hypothetical protein